MSLSGTKSKEEYRYSSGQHATNWALLFVAVSIKEGSKLPNITDHRVDEVYN